MKSILLVIAVVVKIVRNIVDFPADIIDADFGAEIVDDLIAANGGTTRIFSIISLFEFISINVEFLSIYHRIELKD